MDFSDAQVEEAIELVLDRARDGRSATYSEVFAAAHLPAPQLLHATESTGVTRFMKAFHDMCRERSLPPLDALVVNAGGPRQGRPGRGYFVVNGWADPFHEGASAEQVVASARLWEDERQECFTFVG
jgi:hypothetical protein